MKRCSRYGEKRTSSAMLPPALARDRGARVIGSGRSANEALARSFGVDTFVAYDRENVPNAVKMAKPDGVDAVLDLVDDKEAIKTTAPLIRAGGRIVSTIGAADVDWFEQRKILAKNLSASASPQYSHAGLRTLVGLLEQGRIRVIIAGERPLADAVQALDEIKRGVAGKLVLTVS